MDLAIVDMMTGREVDMGGGYDNFGELSHPDDTETLPQEQINNRMILREAMGNNGFCPLAEEWRHFTLENEPYPDTCFDLLGEWKITDNLVVEDAKNHSFCFVGVGGFFFVVCSDTKTPESEDSGVNCSKLVKFSAWRTEEHDVRPSDRTSFFPSFWGHES